MRGPPADDVPGRCVRSLFGNAKCPWLCRCDSDIDEFPPCGPSGKACFSGLYCESNTSLKRIYEALQGTERDVLVAALDPRDGRLASAHRFRDSSLRKAAIFPQVDRILGNMKRDLVVPVELELGRAVEFNLTGT